MLYSVPIYFYSLDCFIVFEIKSVKIKIDNVDFINYLEILNFISNESNCCEPILEKYIYNNIFIFNNKYENFNVHENSLYFFKNLILLNSTLKFKYYIIKIL